MNRRTLGLVKGPRVYPSVVVYCGYIVVIVCIRPLIVLCSSYRPRSSKFPGSLLYKSNRQKGLLLQKFHSEFFKCVPSSTSFMTSFSVSTVFLET